MAYRREPRPNPTSPWLQPPMPQQTPEVDLVAQLMELLTGNPNPDIGGAYNPDLMENWQVPTAGAFMPGGFGTGNNDFNNDPDYGAKLMAMLSGAGGSGLDPAVLGTLFNAGERGNGGPAPDVLAKLFGSGSRNSGPGPDVLGTLFNAGSKPRGGNNFFQNLMDQNAVGNAAENSGILGGLLGAGGGKPAKPTDPFMDAIAELDALINQMKGDSAASSHGVSQGIKKAYGAQIAGIKDLNNDARQDTKVGSKEVRKMYRALQKSYMNAGKREMKQGKNTAAQLQALGAGSAGEATNAANAINAQNVAAAQALGAPDIAAQLNAEVNAQQQGTANQAIAQAGRSARTALGTSDNERKYYNTQGTTARLEGTNRAADMYDQLQDYLEGNQNKIAEIGGQRSAALSSAASQMQGAQSDVLADIIAKKMALLGMSEEHRQSMVPEAQENPLAKLMPGLVASNQLAGQAPPEVQTAFNQLLNDPAMASGQWTSGDNTYDLQGNLPAIQQWLLDNRETDSFENNPDLMAMLQAMIALRLQGHPGAVPPPTDDIVLR